MKKRFSAKALTALLTCVCIVMSSTAIVFADENDGEEDAAPADTELVVADEEEDEEQPAVVESEDETPAEVSDDDITDDAIIEDATDEDITEDNTADDPEAVEDLESVDEQEDPVETAEDIVLLPELTDFELSASIFVYPDDDKFYDEPSYGTIYDNKEGLYAENFTGVNKKTYDFLTDKLNDVATGSESSTKFFISFEELGFDDEYFYADELGIPYIYQDGKQYPTLGTAIFNAASCDLSLMLNRLLVDCPYAAYWWDKTNGTGCSLSYSDFQLGHDNIRDEYFIYMVGGIEYTFPVSVNYADPNSYDTDYAAYYATKASEITRANNAYANAKSIVNQYKDLSDLEKLYKYRDVICQLTDYNNPAAEGGIAYGDPWQWVYVFDNNPNTTVVCEGYSKAFKILFDLSEFQDYDLSCILASGTFTGGGTSGAHMWNIVSFGNGMNYLVDVTNSDDNTVGYPNYLFLANYTTHPSTNEYTYKCAFYSMTYLYATKTTSTYSTDTLSITSAMLLEAPDITFDATCASVTLSWDAVSGVSYYDVFRKDEYSMWDLIGYTNVPSFVDDDVSAGKKYYYCIRCTNDSLEYMNPWDYTQSISTTEHVIAYHSAKAPDCTNPGWTESSYCSVCGRNFVKPEDIPALGHDVVIDEAVEATCEHSGLTEGSHCSRCNEVFVEQEVIPATGHDPVIDPAVPATTTSTGLTEGAHCANCGYVFKAQLVVPKLTTVALLIITQPEDYSGYIGDDAIFNVSASGEGLTYQWQTYKNGQWVNSSLPGAKTSTLSVAITNARDGYVFRCMVKDSSGGTVYSDSATLHVKQSSIYIKTQPYDRDCFAGETAQFYVVVEGSGLTYQWQTYKNYQWVNSSMPGYNTDELSVAVTNARDGYSFRCVISDRNGLVVYSESATLHVKQAITISAQPSNFLGVIGETAEFNVEAEGEGLTYQWEAFRNGTWVVSSLPGAKTSTLSVAVTAPRDGYIFRCAVKNNQGAVIYSDSATLTLKPAITVNTQPVNVSEYAGKTAIFAVEAEGDGLTYQWQVYTNGAWKYSSLPGYNTSELTVAVTNSRDGYKFRCIIKNANGDTVYTDSATLTVKPPVSILIQPSDLYHIAGETAYFNCLADGEGLTYQWQTFKNGQWINSSLPGAKTSELSVAVTNSRNGYIFRCVVKNAKGDIAYSESATLFVIEAV